MKILNFKLKIIELWPILALLLLNLILFATNYKPNTYLIGWDNLMPELNFGVNIQRSIFSAWQEYQSLGLLGGMGHASDLIRQLFLYLASLFLPNDTLRYFWTFLTLFIGGAGMYLLANYVLSIKYKVLNQDENIPNTKYQILNTKLPAFISALFYTLNIATIQTYYVIFETFSAHFASLPWIFLSVILFSKKASLKNFIFLFLVFLLSAPSFYVPTIFVVIVISLFIFLAIQLITFKNKLSIIKNGILIFITLFIVNAYWLLPFSNFTLSNAHVNVNAKIDQMDTESIYLQNKEFGNLIDVAQLKGFWFNTVDPDINGDNKYMLTPWRNHFANPLVPVASLALFAIILIGFLSCFTKLLTTNNEQRTKLAFATLFLFSFTMLATDAAPFSWIDELFRKLPLFSQAFRFPFTKFGILAAFTYSILLAIGINAILQMARRIMNHESRIKVFTLASYFLILASIFWIALPTLQGNLFYSKEKLAIPTEYLATFEYFKKQNPNTRIANLPQPTFWGWTNYSWGSGGSGFLWYAIKQPILDRAFDVWSENSENYYYQLSDAIYSQNIMKLENVLQKYQVSYVLLDESVIYPSSPKSLMTAQTRQMLSKISSVKLEKTYGKIRIYKVALKNKPNNFVFTLPDNLPKVAQPYWSNADHAYSNVGNYISQLSTLNSQLSFPFGSLFSQKHLENGQVKVENKQKYISVWSTVNFDKSSQLIIPDYLENEKIIPVSFYKSTNKSGFTIISAKISGPQIQLDGKNISGNNIDYQLFTLPNEAEYPITINMNGIANVFIRKNSKDGLIGTSFATLSENNRIVVSSTNILETTSIPANIFSVFAGQSLIKIPSGKHSLTINYPKITDSYLSLKAYGKSGKVDNCSSTRPGKNSVKTEGNSLQLTSTNTSGCVHFYSGNLFTDQGYAVITNTKNIKGRALHFWALNEDEKHTPLDLYIDKKHQINSFVLPSEQDSGVGYSFHFENSSIGQNLTTNEINSINVYPIPYKWITGIKIESDQKSSTEQTAVIKSVAHPNESLYIVDFSTLNSQLSTTLVLSQSYDPGWRAYRIMKQESGIMGSLATAFPFIFGQEIKEHVKVNDWENGWIIDNSQLSTPNSQLIIIYLPQYLQYAGFGILIVTSIAIIIKALHSFLRHNK